MSEKLTSVEDAVASLLIRMDSDNVNRAVIREKVTAVAAIQGGFSNEEINLITRKLESRFDIVMSIGTLFSSEDFRPWLDDAREKIDWFYWDRYKRLLQEERFPPKVISSLDSITDQILDHLEDPNKEGGWARKGMIVGHVQSGKTANYIGLINKAADSGYKVIIVLAGLLNSLRNQTQYRIDKGFIGVETDQKNKIGVGILAKEKSPAYFTTGSKDFKKAVANQIGVGLGDLKQPVVLVIKKHKSTLENLIDWLKHNNPHNLQEHPMLLVDDEADHASINTNKKDETATTINRKIRELLKLFNRSSYLGYTATPFANVFIDPETDDEMTGDDLFPRDFILNLDPPSNYVGSARVFSTAGDLNIVRSVSDYEDYIPLRHKKEWQPEDIPSSLKEAIKVFVLSRALRLLRGQTDAHNSMLINVSRYTLVQSHIKLLVEEYVKQLRHSVSNYYKLGDQGVLGSRDLADLKNIFEKEFKKIEFTWSEVQDVLKRAISPIDIIEVNSSSAAEPLDYSWQNYPNGRNVIAVGGLSLSRGLTLEGLTVSYFLRNSIMYDTLMQMGRWFGYRDGYEDLCRIFMTAEAKSWYRHISDVTDELREEFKRMKSAGMAPKDFGLCVRSHPESLIVTARNKMRSGTSVLRKVSLEGRLVETSILLKNPEIVKQNFSAFKAIIRDADKYGETVTVDAGYLWTKVPSKYVLQFIERFQNHPASQLTEKQPLQNYIKSYDLYEWDIALISLREEKEADIGLGLADYPVIAQERKVNEYPDRGGNGIALNKRRVASRGAEKIGLSSGQIKLAEQDYQGKNIPDLAYRALRDHPLLMLHILDCQLSSSNFSIPAYGISFPGLAGSRRPKKLVEYVVNTVWWKNEYFELLDDEGEFDE